ncbi:MAG: DEAD/DEAH box helicase [Euryarchaeota archaeon]|nr:DEAD/DEAH box helicase [Euryarchaeota archaeon]
MERPGRIRELGLPAELVSLLEAQGLDALYPPQAEAVGPALEGKNLLLALPTASGKSLVAYLAVLRKVLAGGRALYIVPLRALASEKADDLRTFEPLGLSVGVATGDYDSPGVSLDRHDIVIATSEKADSLLRHRAGWLSELSVIVADEVHLIGDPDRGPTLEVILTRFRQLNPGAQLLALSATVANSKEMAAWLGAEHRSSDWRPVKLREGVLFDGTVQFADNRRLEVGEDAEPSFPLIRKVLSEGGQALVFVNSRKSAEAMARKAGPLVSGVLGKAGRDAAGETAGALEEAEPEWTSMAKRLADCARAGAAFHHAGLTASQRRAVESGFRAGKLRLLVATPTLAAGINLPARCVIIRDIRRFEAGSGQVFIPVHEIKQMAGRAGRPRYDKEGDAVVVARTESDRDIILSEYLLGGPEPIDSKLGTERAFREHALSSVATGFASTPAELGAFFRSTFHAHQSVDDRVDEMVDSALEFLVGERLVERRPDRLAATPYGRRVSELYIDPLSARVMRQALEKAGGRERPPLAYLAVAASTPDLRRVGMYLRRGDLQWLDAVADRARPELIVPPPDDPGEYEWFLADLKLACLLQDWIDEKSEDEMTSRYDIGPGDIHAKVDTGRWILYSMRELGRLLRCGREDALDTLNRRVADGIKAELLDLVRLRGVGRVRARSLFDNGYRSRAHLSRADRAKLARVPRIGPKVAGQILSQLGVSESGGPEDDGNAGSPDGKTYFG